MKCKIICLLSIATLVLSLNVSAQTRRKMGNSSFLDRVYKGGNLGLQFGNVTNIQISPIAGYKITNDFSVGLGIQYQYTKDKRFNPTLTGSNYGLTIFSRYNIVAPFYLQAEYEYLDYAYSENTSEVFRATASSFFVGGGISQRLGSNSAFTLSVLYNLSYDETKVPRPYYTPLKISGGIAFGL